MDFLYRHPGECGTLPLFCLDKFDKQKMPEANTRCAGGLNAGCAFLVWVCVLFKDQAFLL